MCVGRAVDVWVGVNLATWVAWDSSVLAVRLETCQRRPVWDERSDLIGTCATDASSLLCPSRPVSRFKKKGNRMPDSQQAVIAGIHCHTDFHVAAALDPLGRVLGTESFPATCAGYGSTHRWLASFGQIAAVGVESTGSYGAALIVVRAGLPVSRGQPAASAPSRPPLQR